MKIQEFLGEIEVFKGLNASDIEKVANICIVKEFKDGDTIFSKDDMSEELYILQSGRCDVKIFMGSIEKAYTLYQLNVGDIFGELGFIDGSPRSATVNCNKEAKVIILPREAFAMLCSENTHIGHILMKNIAVVLAHKLRETDEEIKNFSLPQKIRFRKLFHIG
ncbi:MAG: cyclic nucleotide-binding domain-containing protein [Candidatus Stahlbacteria bacterium]|nr:cyclic nucleotide-binding domain-containing protein [Candidatus Stahlbacteria bacterium]